MVEEKFCQITEEVITAHRILTFLIVAEIFWTKLPKLAKIVRKTPAIAFFNKTNMSMCF